MSYSFPKTPFEWSLLVSFIFVSFLLRKYFRNTEEQRLTALARRLNGQVKSEKGLLSGLNSVLTVQYDGINFTISEFETGGRNSARIMTINAKADFPLIALRIIKKIGLFVLDGNDMPLSVYGTKDYVVETTPRIDKTKAKEIVIDNKHYYVESDQVVKVMALIEQTECKEDLKFILKKYNTIEVDNNTIRMGKHWSRKDIDNNEVVKLFDRIVHFSQIIRES